MRGWTLPERTLGRAVARRALLFWAGVRLLLGVPALFAAAPPGRVVAAALAPENALLAVLAAAFPAVLETRRRNEHLLLADLGTGPAGVASLAGVPPLLGEAALRLLTGP